MPDFLAPGVYVEETSFRSRSIVGAETSTTAFVGPTRRGPISGAPELLTSPADFERLYGGLENLNFAGSSSLNYVAHATRAYFDNGGRRLYVMRTVGAGARAASAVLRDGTGNASRTVTLKARFPGEAGNGRVMLRISEQPVASRQTLDLAPADSLLLLRFRNAPGRRYCKGSDGVWREVDGTELPASTLDGTGTLDPTGDGPPAAALLSLAVTTQDADGFSQSWQGLGFGPAHSQAIHTVLAKDPERPSAALTPLVWSEIGVEVSALELYDCIAGLEANADGDRLVRLSGGCDGEEPVAGAASDSSSYAAALARLADLEDIATVAAPGSSALADSQAITDALISHAERQGAYRIAVVDAPPDRLPDGIRLERSRIDSRYAAVYYPWVVISNPLVAPGRNNVPAEIALPPSGFICGIYARTDAQRGVHRSPANEQVNGALRFAHDVTGAEQARLDDLGINCLRQLPARGLLLWGARLASSDPEWKYVSQRRYVNYLEASIDRGTQWAVFEPNGQELWSSVMQTIGHFLFNEWRHGALVGSTPAEAFFVRCDRSTMSQSDLDNGRLICLIGVALLRPAEFSIVRFGQRTADARN